MPFSDKPWSNFSESDYTPEQWIKACLIHMTASPKTKSDAKLPVREPDGMLNKNAIHAAAAALAGARGGVDAPPAAKKSAARKIISLYREMKEQAPDSVYRVAGEKPPAKKE